MTLSVGGMTCGGCASSVTRALEAAGFEVLEVSLEKETATVADGNRDVAIQAIQDAGFDAS